MSSPASSTPVGSRTAAYLVAGALATVPVWLVLGPWLGFYATTGGVITVWVTGVVWLLRRRQEDPAWDQRPPVGRA